MHFVFNARSACSSNLAYCLTLWIGGRNNFCVMMALGILLMTGFYLLVVCLFASSCQSSTAHSLWLLQDWQLVQWWALFTVFLPPPLSSLSLSLSLATIYSKLEGEGHRLIYRHYATLYFVFCVDSAESQLGILDLIQVSYVWGKREREREDEGKGERMGRKGINVCCSCLFITCTVRVYRCL